MNAGERIKILRKHLKLTQVEFAEKLGMTHANISYLESGKSTLTEATAKAICREFNVDYFWLTEGTGEMFVEPPDETEQMIDIIAKQYNLSEQSRSILEAYITLNSDQRKVVDNFVDVIVQLVKKEKTEE